MPAGLPELRASVDALEAQAALIEGNLTDLSARLDLLAADAQAAGGVPELTDLTNRIAVTTAGITQALNEWSAQALSQSYVAPAIPPLEP